MRRSPRPITVSSVLFGVIELVVLWTWFPTLHYLIFRNDPVPVRYGAVALFLALLWLTGILRFTAMVVRDIFTNH